MAPFKPMFRIATLERVPSLAPRDTDMALTSRAAKLSKEVIRTGPHQSPSSTTSHFSPHSSLTSPNSLTPPPPSSIPSLRCLTSCICIEQGDKTGRRRAGAERRLNDHPHFCTGVVGSPVHSSLAVSSVGYEKYTLVAPRFEP